MSSPSARVPTPLRLLVVASDEHLCDPTRLIAAVGHNVDVTVAVTVSGDECSPATLLVAAGALEELGRRGVRARYLELPEQLVHGIAAWIERDEAPAERLVLVDAALGQRRIRQLRRRLRDLGSHLGVVPGVRDEEAVAS